MKSRAHIMVTGMVQGVGFRAFVQRRALTFGLTGWVRNRSDGSVEIAVEGEKEKIESLLGFCRRGPELSHVEEVAVTWEDFSGEFSSFHLRF